MGHDRGHHQHRPNPAIGARRRWAGAFPVAAAATAAATSLAFGAPPVAAMAAAAVAGAFPLLRRPAGGDRHGGTSRTVAALNKAVFDSVADGIVGVDVDGRITFVNPAAEILGGWREEELIGRPHGVFFGAAVALPGHEAAAPCRDEASLPRRNADSVPVEVQVSAIVERGRVTGHVIVIHDIRERLQAEQSRRLAAAVLEGSAQPIVVADLAGTVVTVNPAFCRLSGFAADEIVGQPVSILRSDCHDAQVHAEIRSHLDRTGAWRGEVWNRRKNGSPYAVWLSITRIAAPPGGSGVLVAFYFDITERKRQEQSMVEAANHDALTKLPNRRHFETRLAALAAAADRQGRNAAILLIDLDGFKQVNDTHGHDAGDAVLCAMAERMSTAIRVTDLAARLGGDEFVVLLADADGHAAARVAQTLVGRLSLPVPFQGVELQVSASIGIAFMGPDAAPADVLKAADRAMYAVKRGGKHGFRFHDDGDFGS